MAYIAVKGTHDIIKEEADAFSYIENNTKYNYSVTVEFAITIACTCVPTGISAS